MTTDLASGLGPLGRRLLLAFTLVALASVLMVTVAALIGSERGISASAASDRDQTAVDVAEQSAQAFATAGGWENADLTQPIATAASAGARLQVRDASGSLIGGSDLNGQGMGMGMGRAAIEQPVVVDGVIVGSVRLGFGRTQSDAGRGIAWTWILIAALAAVVVAVIVSWFVARQITRPIHQLAAVSAAFAAGDRRARANLQRTDEIGDLARTFDSTADEIAQAERVRRNLSADVAHELRTPLTALLAGLEEVRDGLTPADEETLTRLHDQASRLGRIVNDLAALSAAESPSPSARLTRIDLTGLAEQSVAAHSAQLRSAGLVLTTDVGGPLPVMADADRLGQVLGNLLSNAARYCRPGDHVTVRTVADGDACLLQVIDSGPGITAADLPHVFDRFWRGSSTSNVAGSGLGLAVTRALVEAQAGTIHVESDGTSGTTFTVRLPRAAID